MTTVRFSVLGPLTVVLDGTPAPITVGKIRILLATLLLRPNEVVPSDLLIERLWGPRAPANPRKVLQIYVVRLRQALGLRHVILTMPGGYLARLQADQLDLLQFHRLVQEAGHAADPETERRLLHEALDLWRGPVCADIASETLHQIDVPPLAELRLHTLERRIGIDADQGEDATLIAELRALTAEHPFRERLWAQLMTALYRTGRQAEALETYRAVFRLLQDELGISPNAELRRLHQDMLTEKPVEAPAASGPPAPVPPRQLPADVPVFAGRADELTVLDGGADAAAMVVTTIDGMAGIGKTTLAVHAAHLLAPRFPDGQVFVDLHGHSQGATPLGPADALDRLLRALVRPGERIPAHLDDRVGLYRSLLAGRRLLIVLDNAASEAQVRPLLPGGVGCHVLITSRRRLTGLHATRAVTLDVLTEADALTLFTRTAGADRVAGESRRLLATAVERCGRLPLAVRVAAARLRSHPTWDLAHLLGRLGDDQQQLETGLELSYRDLDGPQRHAYRLLSLHPADQDADAAAALLGIPPARAERLLEQLLNVHLLQEPAPGRYRFHPLVRDHAVRAAREVSADDRRAAMTRLLDHYARTRWTCSAARPQGRGGPRRQGGPRPRPSI